MNVDGCMEALMHCGTAAFDAGPANDVAGCVVKGGVWGVAMKFGAILLSVILVEKAVGNIYLPGLYFNVTFLVYRCGRKICGSWMKLGDGIDHKIGLDAAIV